MQAAKFLGARGFISLVFPLALILGACDDPQAIKDAVDRLTPPGGGAGPTEPKTCGGVVGATCAKNEFCDVSGGTCSAAGVCRTKPEICTTIYAPVCGCDRKTYGNDCNRAAAGVSKLHDGACVQSIEAGDGESCGGFTPPPIRVCKPTSFCMQRPGTCGLADAAGVCEPTPTACTKEYAPVCGCDGKTYGNDCTRRAARVALDYTGECKPRGGQEGALCGGFGGLPCAAGLFCEFGANMCNVADNAGVCRVRPQICRDIYSPVCGCDGKTYGNDCERQAATIAKSHDGACK